MHQAKCHETWMGWNDFCETQDTIQLTHLEPRAHEKCVWHVLTVRGAVFCSQIRVQPIQRPKSWDTNEEPAVLWNQNRHGHPMTRLLLGKTVEGSTLDTHTAPIPTRSCPCTWTTKNGREERTIGPMWNNKRKYTGLESSNLL